RCALLRRRNSGLRPPPPPALLSRVRIIRCLMPRLLPLQWSVGHKGYRRCCLLQHLQKLAE
ncbi:hypothetical protein MIMGU_mgv1a0214172mg, partial [Erythranthe guttata]